MASVKDFLRTSTEFLKHHSWEQLVKIPFSDHKSEHFTMDVGDKRLKENVRKILTESVQLEVGFF